MAEKFGVKETTELLDLVGGVFDAAGHLAALPKEQRSVGALLVKVGPALLVLQNALDGVELISQELRDLSEAEFNALMKSEFRPFAFKFYNYGIAHLQRTKADAAVGSAVLGISATEDVLAFLQKGYESVQQVLKSKDTSLFSILGKFSSVIFDLQRVLDNFDKVDDELLNLSAAEFDKLLDKANPVLYRLYKDLIQVALLKLADKKPA